MNLRYVHLDNLGSTSVVTDSSGAQYGYTRYYPYGSTRDSSGSLDTSKKFTGQRLDGTGLYYYGARYYDPVIGRFISPDTMVPDPANPQALNRYSYVLNNPLKYTDPTGHGWWSFITDIASVGFDIYQLVKHPSWSNAGWLAADVGLTLLPVVPAGVGPAAKAIGKADKVIEDADKLVEGVRVGSKTEKIVVKASKGFDSFDALKKAMGSAGENKEWHHIVEQCQAEAERAGFDVKLIQNPQNVIAIDKKTNEAVNAYYSSQQRFTAGKTVRDWLTG